jgi:hypothetical protein
LIDAILVPLIRAELPDLYRWLAQLPTVGSKAITIVFSIDSAWTEGEKEFVIELLTKSRNSDKLYPKFLDCNIPKSQSCYIKDNRTIDLKKLPYGRKSGPNIQFFFSISWILDNIRKVRSLILLETDAYPTVDNWISELNNRLAWCPPYVFVVGATSEDSLIQTAITHHINGNAIYMVGHDKFRGFLKTWEQVLLKCVRCNPGVAYDVSLAYCDALRHHDKCVMEAGDLYNDFFDTWRECCITLPVIRNLSRARFQFTGKEGVARFVRENPDTIVLHGRYRVEGQDVISEYFRTRGIQAFKKST